MVVCEVTLVYGGHDPDRKMVQVLGNLMRTLVGRYVTVMMTRRIVMVVEATHLWMSERIYPHSW